MAALGASVTRYDSDYGTVAEETVTIRMKQTRVDVAGDWRAPIGPVTSLKFRFGHSDYEHTEFEGDEVAWRIWEGARERAGLPTLSD